MNIDIESTVPIYIQIAEAIEDMILEGNIQEEEQVPSTNQLAEFYKLNPATARKGLAILTDEGILFKKRGLGMFVCKGANAQIKGKRKKGFIDQYVTTLLNECNKLDITIDEVIQIIKDKEMERRV